MRAAAIHRPHTSRTTGYGPGTGIAIAVPVTGAHLHAQAHTHPHAQAHASNNAHTPRLNEVFVGDLSFFCAEDHLLQLFSAYGQVVSVRIVRNDENNRSRTFGFVGMGSVEEAQHVASLLHGRLFMGRYMKVELTAFKHAPRRDKDPGFEVHVAFTASASVGQLNEVLLRKVFNAYGSINDVVVRDYHISESGEQTGYGFATFPDLESALSVIQRCSSFFPLPGLHLRCTPGHRVQACLRERAQWELLREQRERERERERELEMREYLERQRFLQQQQQQQREIAYREAMLSQERGREREWERMHWASMQTHAPLAQRPHTAHSSLSHSLPVPVSNAHAMSTDLNSNANAFNAHALAAKSNAFSPALPLSPPHSLSVSSSSPPLPPSLSSSPVQSWRVENIPSLSSDEEQQMIDNMFSFNFLG